MWNLRWGFLTVCAQAVMLLDCKAMLGAAMTANNSDADRSIFAACEPTMPGSQWYAR